MSTEYRIHGRDIKLDELLSSTQLVEIVTKQTTKTDKFISPDENGGGCWFYLNDDGVITGFTRYGDNYEAAEFIQNAIEYKFKVDVPSEYDDDYYDEEDREEMINAEMWSHLSDFFEDYFEVRQEAQEIHDHCMNARFLLDESNTKFTINGDLEWDDTQCGSHRSIEDNENYFFELLNPGE